MICRLCLKDVQCIINIFDELGIELSVAEIVAKHFWFEPKPDDPISKSLCEVCWHKVAGFNSFYCMVEEAHRLLTERFSLNSNAQRTKPTLTTTRLKEESAVSTTFKQNTDSSLLEGYERNVDLITLPIVANAKQATTVELEEVVCNENNTIETNTSNDFGEQDEISTYLALSEINESDQDALEEAPVLRASKRNRRNTRAASAEKKLLSTPTNSLKRKISKPLNAITVETTPKRSRGRPSRKVTANMTLKNHTSSTEILNANEDTEKSSQSYKDKIRKGNERIAQFLVLSCDFCSEKHETFATLCKHMTTSHGQNGFAICCNKKFYKRAALLDHVERHLNPGLFSCKECDKKFADKYCLKNHINIKHLPEELKTFACDICNKKFGKIYLLEQHQRTHKERNHICDVCQKGFPSHNQLKAHIKVIHQNYGTMCEICSKVIRGRAAFTKHMLQHEGIDLPKVQCPKCGSWHKDKYSLQKHIRRHNIDGAEHVCNECGKVAPNRSALLSHKRYVHKAERSYKCGVCKKAFKIQISLKEHMATHTGQALYTCPYCSRTFNSNANMHSHRKKMHPKEFAEARLRRQKQDLTPESNEIDEIQIKDDETEEQATDEMNQQQDITVDSSNIINLDDDVAGDGVDSDEETHILMTTDKFGELVFKVE